MENRINMMPFEYSQPIMYQLRVFVNFLEHLCLLTNNGTEFQ